MNASMLLQLQIAANRSTVSGNRAANCSSRRAAPVGSVRPCSQFSRVRFDTPSDRANSDCESPERARAAMISHRAPVRISSFSTVPSGRSMRRRTAPSGRVSNVVRRAQRPALSSRTACNNSAPMSRFASRAANYGCSSTPSHHPTCRRLVGPIEPCGHRRSLAPDHPTPGIRTGVLARLRSRHLSGNPAGVR